MGFATAQPNLLLVSGSERMLSVVTLPSSTTKTKGPTLPSPIFIPNGMFRNVTWLSFPHRARAEQHADAFGTVAFDVLEYQAQWDESSSESS